MQLRHEIKALQNRLGFTAIHVTHDREEAMTMADRHRRHGCRAASPRSARRRRSTTARHSPFVASFMGAENTLDLDVAPARGGRRDRAPATRARRSRGAAPAPAGPVDAPISATTSRSSTRPTRAVAGAIVLPGTDRAARPIRAAITATRVAIGGRHFTVTDDRYLDLDTPVGLRLPLRRLHLFPSAQGQGRTLMT